MSITLSSAIKKVIQFHDKFGLPLSSMPGFPSDGRRKLRLELIREEFEELKEADSKEDLVEVADALADLMYVIYGMALEYGIPLDDVFREVHRSNMTKVWPDGTAHIREDGKILKPPTYSPPDIKPILYDILKKGY